MKRTQWRQRILVAVLAVTIVLSAASGEDPEAAQRPEKSPERTATALPQRLEPARPPTPAVPRIELERLQRQDGGDGEVGNLFGATSWYVPPPPPPPPPPPKPVPPPPPTAPPMPFSFLGRYIEDGTLIILLVKGERIYTVSEGEVIEKTYRVERLHGGVLELTYLPLNIKQTISTG